MNSWMEFLKNCYNDNTFELFRTDIALLHNYIGLFLKVNISSPNGIKKLITLLIQTLKTQKFPLNIIIFQSNVLLDFSLFVYLFQDCIRRARNCFLFSESKAKSCLEELCTIVIVIFKISSNKCTTLSSSSSCLYTSYNAE